MREFLCVLMLSSGANHQCWNTLGEGGYCLPTIYPGALAAREKAFTLQKATLGRLSCQRLARATTSIITKPQSAGGLLGVA